MMYDKKNDDVNIPDIWFMSARTICIGNTALVNDTYRVQYFSRGLPWENEHHLKSKRFCRISFM